MSDKNSWSCWSCKNPVTMTRRADADGNCPHCRAELDIELWPFPDKPEPLHPHNDGLDECRQKPCCHCGACPAGCVAEGKP